MSVLPKVQYKVKINQDIEKVYECEPLGSFHPIFEIKNNGIEDWPSDCKIKCLVGIYEEFVINIKSL